MTRYAITVTRRYYGPRETVALLEEPDGSIAQYATRREARAAVQALDRQVYYLSQNESSRAEYRLVEVGSRRYVQAARA